MSSLSSKSVSFCLSVCLSIYLSIYLSILPTKHSYFFLSYSTLFLFLLLHSFVVSDFANHFVDEIWLAHFGSSNIQFRRGDVNYPDEDNATAKA